MMIKCIECGHENQLGSIFCRECGAKLDVDRLRPEVKDTKAKINVLGLVRTVVTVGIFLALVWVLVSMFYPVSVVSPVLGEKEQKAVDAKFKALMTRIDEQVGDDKYTFTPEEVTYLYNNVLTEKAAGEGAAYSVDKMVFNVDAMSGVVRIAMLSHLYGMTTSFEITGVLDPDKPGLTVTGQRMGHFSVPNGLRKKVIDKFTPALNDPQGGIRKILDKAESISAEDGDLVIKIKPEEK
jgi:hypothetical protein